jgi:hypothetical protein
VNARNKVLLLAFATILVTTFMMVAVQQVAATRSPIVVEGTQYTGWGRITITFGTTVYGGRSYETVQIKYEWNVGDITRGELYQINLRLQYQDGTYDFDNNVASHLHQCWVGQTSGTWTYGPTMLPRGTWTASIYWGYGRSWPIAQFYTSGGPQN